MKQQGLASPVFPSFQPSLHYFLSHNSDLDFSSQRLTKFILFFMYQTYIGLMFASELYVICLYLFIPMSLHPFGDACV